MYSSPLTTAVSTAPTTSDIKQPSPFFSIANTGTDSKPLGKTKAGFIDQIDEFIEELKKKQASWTLSNHDRKLAMFLNLKADLQKLNFGSGVLDDKIDLAIMEHLIYIVSSGWRSSFTYSEPKPLASIQAAVQPTVAQNALPANTI